MPSHTTNYLKRGYIIIKCPLKFKSHDLIPLPHPNTAMQREPTRTGHFLGNTPATVLPTSQDPSWGTGQAWSINVYCIVELIRFAWLEAWQGRYRDQTVSRSSTRIRLWCELAHGDWELLTWALLRYHHTQIQANWVTLWNYECVNPCAHWLTVHLRNGRGGKLTNIPSRTRNISVIILVPAIRHCLKMSIVKSSLIWLLGVIE